MLFAVSTGLSTSCEEEIDPAADALNLSQMTIIRSDGSRVQAQKVSEIENALTFPIILPTYLPDESRVDSMQVDERPGVLLIGLQNPSLPTALMILEEHPGPVRITEALPNLEVTGTPAQFVPSGDVTGVQALAWSPCGRGFVLRAALSEEELVRIAQSMPVQCS
jgi:hypothetical protein